MNVDITTKGPIAKVLMERLKAGKIRDCHHLLLERVPAGWFNVECKEDWAEKDEAHNVATSPTGYGGPSSYYWPVCPVDCPHYKKAENFIKSVTRDQYDDQELDRQEAFHEEPVHVLRPAKAKAAPEMPGATDGAEVKYAGKVKTFPSHRWKEHPVIVPIAAFIGGAGLALVVCFTYVLPVMTQQERNDLKSQAVQLDSLQNSNNGKDQQISDLNKRIAALNDQNGKMATQIGVFEFDKLISETDLYPVMFRTIRIGSPVSLIAQTYDKASIHVHKELTTVELNDSLFSEVTFFTEDCKVPKVSNILFVLRDPKRIDTLIARYKQNFPSNSFYDVDKRDDDGITYLDTPSVSGVYVEFTHQPEKPTYVYASLQIKPKGGFYECKNKDGYPISSGVGF